MNANSENNNRIGISTIFRPLNAKKKLVTNRQAGRQTDRQTDRERKKRNWLQMASQGG